MPEEHLTVLPLGVADVDMVVTVLEEAGLHCLPQLRWLLLGPYATSGIFPPGFCSEPTMKGVDEMLAALEENGFAATVHILQNLAGRGPDLLERHLDHLESLAVHEWQHPVHALERPWELDRLLPLSIARAQAASIERRPFLLSIVAKLQKAFEVEERAAERRLEQSMTQHFRRKRKREKERRDS
jgi:hypothetical protein